MTTDQLKKVLGNYKWSLLVTFAMLAMVAFGYQLARIVDQGHYKKVLAQNDTIAILSEENNALQTRVNQLEVAAELAKLETEAITEVANASKKQLEEQQEIVTFYERVMAPEKGESVLAVEGVEVFKLDDNRYQLRMVLLQTRRQKAVINGSLKVSVEGVKDKQSMTLTSGNSSFMPQDIKYRFRFFQAVNVDFTIPEGLEPERISFSTSVYQYKTRKAQFDVDLSWQDALAVEIE
jgi:cell division protein FtsB